MRPIDADVLENMGYELHRTYRQDANTMVYEVKKIADVPTIEAEPNSCKYWDSESHFCALRRPQAEPVCRGRWIPFDLTWGRSVYSCTCCKEAMEVPCVCGEPMFKFCPNCGSRMEEQE